MAPRRNWLGPTDPGGRAVRPGPDPQRRSFSTACPGDGARRGDRPPAAGRLRQTRAAARFSETPTEIRLGAPALGEHTDDMLAELGYSAGEIAELHADGVVA